MFPARFSVCWLALASLCIFEIARPSAALPFQRILAPHRQSRTARDLKTRMTGMAISAREVSNLIDTLHSDYVSILREFFPVDVCLQGTGRANVRLRKAVFDLQVNAYNIIFFLT